MWWCGRSAAAPFVEVHEPVGDQTVILRKVYRLASPETDIELASAAGGAGRLAVPRRCSRSVRGRPSAKWRRLMCERPVMSCPFGSHSEQNRGLDELERLTLGRCPCRGTTAPTELASSAFIVNVGSPRKGQRRYAFGAARVHRHIKRKCLRPILGNRWESSPLSGESPSQLSLSDISRADIAVARSLQRAYLCSNAVRPRQVTSG